MAERISYRWICHKCRAENEAGLTKCASCWFPAVASAEEAGLIPSVTHRPKSVIFERVGLFFPEVIVAVGVVLYSPFWLASLLLTGKWLAAVLLFVSVCLGATLYWFATGHRHATFLVWVSMALVIIGALGTHKLAQ